MWLQILPPFPSPPPSASGLRSPGLALETAGGRAGTDGFIAPQAWHTLCAGLSLSGGRFLHNCQLWPASAPPSPQVHPGAHTFPVLLCILSIPKSGTSRTSNLLLSLPYHCPSVAFHRSFRTRTWTSLRSLACVQFCNLLQGLGKARGAAPGLSLCQRDAHQLPILLYSCTEPCVYTVCAPQLIHLFLYICTLWYGF